MEPSERASAAAAGARGRATILSANPMHDTGGGQRSAQLALELLERDHAVLFVSHGKVTETVDLGLRPRHDRLVEVPLGTVTRGSGYAALSPFLSEGAMVITQVPVAEWEPVLARAREVGARTIYDCIDRWDSELGRGWYDRGVEARIARASDVLVASAPELVQHVELLAEREARLLPNAYNGRIFRRDVGYERPADLPEGHVALYVGALWGGWLDWKLVRHAAEELPDTLLVFVGDYRGEGGRLPPNCRFLGLKPQRDLPAYLAHADVAFLPWRDDAVTQATSPLKVYEFVAMGLPVLAPPLETLRGIPGVYAFTDGSSLVHELRGRRKGRLAAAVREEMAAFAARSSWADRVDTLLELGRASGGPRAGGRRTPPGTGGILSVVIPAYNHEHHVGAAVDSVRRQTLPAGELVVVDDGSTDGTHDVLAAARFPGMRLIRQENRGAHAAINRAVALATGDWVAILNSDDVFLPERLEHAWAVARTTGAALVIGSVRMVDEHGEPLADDHPSSRWYREARAEPGRSRSLARALRRHNFAVTTSNFFLHRELWRRLGGFGAHRYVHDLDFLLRALALDAGLVQYAPELEDVLYRVHPHNTILEDVPRALEERASLFRRLRWPRPRARALLRRPADRRRIRSAVQAAGSLAPVVEAAGERGPSLRVGLVARALDEGGLEEAVALLALSLPAQGVEPHVLCTHQGGRVATRLAQAGVPVTVADGRPAAWRRWAEQASPDAINTQFAGEEVIRTLVAVGAPVVETVQNVYAWFRAADWETERRKHGLLRGTIAASRLVADYYARHVGAPPTPHVIPNAVHPARVASVPRAWARRRLSVPLDAPLFVSLGRITPQKNVAGLLRAFAVVHARVPAARLLVAGARAEAAYLRRVRREHRRLLHTGAARLLRPEPHVGALLSAADAYVSNAFFEGWSLAASEAAWLGLPLVLSECGGSRELVGDAGERGHLVANPLGDPLGVTWDAIERPDPEALRHNEAALADAMLRVIEAGDAWRGRREDIQAHARKEVAPERFAGAYAAVLRALADRVRAQ